MVSLRRRFSRGSWCYSGNLSATTWHGVTPTPCRYAIATTLRQEVEPSPITPLWESVCQWKEICHALLYATCLPSVLYTCDWRCPTPRARKRAERSRSRPRRTVSTWYIYIPIPYLLHLYGVYRLNIYTIIPRSIAGISTLIRYASAIAPLQILILQMFGISINGWANISNGSRWKINNPPSSLNRNEKFAYICIFYFVLLDR